MIIFLILIFFCCGSCAQDVYSHRIVYEEKFTDNIIFNKYWKTEVGFIRNLEEQYYTENFGNNYIFDLNGLTIKAKKEKIKNKFFDKNSEVWKFKREFGEYTSASLTTKGLASWRYGIFEFTAKLDSGHGYWPAIWFLGDNIDTIGYPACGEIDLMEYFGRSPLMIQSNIFYRGSGGNKLNKLSKYPYPNDGAYHKFSMEWTYDKIIFYIDGVVTGSFDVEDASVGSYNPFRNNMHIILNVALGGPVGGDIDNKDYMFSIKNIKIYQK